MENARLRECLASDFARLREVVAGADPQAGVPTCPGWKMTDLTEHVAQVYLHKAECMVQGVEPDPWPPDGLTEEAVREPLGLLDRAYAALVHELDTRPPDAASGGWYKPDRTVGFWIRRMAQETAIHRIDAELAAGSPQAPVPDDLAIDGIDEFMLFLVYGTTEWPEWTREVLEGSDGGGVRLATTGRSWLVRPTTESVLVASDEAGPAQAEVGAVPVDLLRWVWGRAGDEAVRITGETERAARLRKIFAFVSQ